MKLIRVNETLFCLEDETKPPKQAKHYFTIGGKQAADFLMDCFEKNTAAPVQAQEPVAWMTEDGRVSTAETKNTAMASTSRPVFNIPLFLAAAPVQNGHFPQRDQSKPAEQQGVFQKFEVRRTDGSSAPGGKHHNCRYFVLDVDHDALAKPALQAYAAASAATHPDLSADMVKRFDLAPVRPVAVPECCGSSEFCERVTCPAAPAAQGDDNLQYWGDARQAHCLGQNRRIGEIIDFAIKQLEK